MRCLVTWTRKNVKQPFLPKAPKTRSFRNITKAARKIAFFRKNAAENPKAAYHKTKISVSRRQL